jgi:cytochrome c-type biogenesis protein CcmH/NrfG
MANAMPPNSKGPAQSRGKTGAPPIERNTVEARQGRGGRNVLLILAVSLVLIAIAYIILYFFYPRPQTPHQAGSESPPLIFAAAAPVATPTMAPATISLSQW